MKLFGTWRKDPPPDDEQPFVADLPAGSAANKIVLTGSHANFGKGRKILVVDDNAVVVKTFELKLKSCGFEVVSATEGSAAISLAQRTQPDLILLDINFPPDVGNSGLQWNGFNIMQWLGRFKEIAGIPVIIITSGDPEKLRQVPCRRSGGFFQKPIKFDDFLAAIDRVMPRKADPATPA